MAFFPKSYSFLRFSFTSVIHFMEAGRSNSSRNWAIIVENAIISHCWYFNKRKWSSNKQDGWLTLTGSVASVFKNQTFTGSSFPFVSVSCGPDSLQPQHRKSNRSVSDGRRDTISELSLFEIPEVKQEGAAGVQQTSLIDFAVREALCSGIIFYLLLIRRKLKTKYFQSSRSRQSYVHLNNLKVL